MYYEIEDKDYIFIEFKEAHCSRIDKALLTYY